MDEVRQEKINEIIKKYTKEFKELMDSFVCLETFIDQEITSVEKNFFGSVPELNNVRGKAIERAEAKYEESNKAYHAKRDLLWDAFLYSIFGQSKFYGLPSGKECFDVLWNRAKKKLQLDPVSDLAQYIESLIFMYFEEEKEFFDLLEKLDVCEHLMSKNAPIVG